MSELAERLRAARRMEITVDHITFFVIRPKESEWTKYSRENVSDDEVCAKHIYDWKGVRECDLIKGGSKDEVPFDRDVLMECVPDNTAWWAAIIGGMSKATTERVEERNKNQKK